MSEPQNNTGSEARETVSRRGLLQIIGSVPAVAAVTAGSATAHAHDHAHAADGGAGRPSRRPLQTPDVR